VQPWVLRHSGASLEMSGHLYEAVTPYPWTRQMQSVIGGDVFTIDDDSHASGVEDPECAAHMVGYFDTGQPYTGQCPGVPVLSSAATG
jgi:hypothetical protein